MWTIKSAEAVVGSLSKPSKMPGYAYGLPASKCITGSVLAKLPNTPCSKCYAMKGRYSFPNTLNAQMKRLNSLRDIRWVDAITFLIKKRGAYFRWHDSGDLQSIEHLINIVEVANRCPEINFWLPTSERAFVSTYLRDVGEFPSNLTVRVSGALIDGDPPAKFPNTSTVVKSGVPTCPAPTQGGICGNCRRCWDPTVKNVAYKEH